MGHLYQDLRYSFRTFSRTPGFTAIAVLTLALGIGANTAIFSLVYAVILKPLPFREPSRLIAVWDTFLPQFPAVGISPAELSEWRGQRGLFEQTAWYRHVPFNMTLTGGAADALEVHATFTSPELLPTLGAAPVVGSGLSGGAPNQAVLSYSLWQSRFGGDPGIAGKAIRLNDQEFTVAGVMPAAFRFPEWADVWLPPGPLQGDELTNPIRHAVGFVARLRPGISTAQASARLETISRRLATEHPRTSTGWGVKVINLQRDLTASVRPSLLLLFGAVTLVLLIACGNMANLLLSRASGRAREMAVRTALGAGSWRLVRQLVTESVVLAAAGGGLGLALAATCLDASPIPAPIDRSVLLFLLVVSTATGLICALAPALESLRSDPNAIMKSASQPGGGRSRARGALVVLEFALAVMLVAGAGMLVKSFEHLMRVEPGFTSRGLLTLRISVPPSRQPQTVFRELQERLGKLPGVEWVSASNTLPLIANRANVTRFTVPGSPLIDPNALPVAQIRLVSPDYFRAMEIPIRAGRAFEVNDLTGNNVMVNENLARRFWRGGDAIGRQFVTGALGPNSTLLTIVGVAGNVKNFGLDSEPTMDLYFPSAAPAYLVVRSAGDPASLAGAVRREIQAVDAGLPVSEVRTMDEIVARSSESRRWTMGLLTVFAGLALLLALIGIYGVMSWLVTERTREIGVRMALGAGRGEVLRMVMGYGARLSAIGMVLGVAGAFGLRRVLSGLVFEVSTADPLIYGGVVLLMAAVSLLACYLPARRAAGVDPLTALRQE